MKTNRKSSIINLFYVETPLHLFYSIIIEKNLGSKSYLIVDLHRIKQKQLVASMDPILKNFFDKILFAHDFDQLSNLSIRYPFRSISYLIQLFKETSKILNEINDLSSVIHLYIFSLNRIERILFNRLKKKSLVKLTICEEGVGSYTSEFYLIGRDYEYYNNFSLFKIIRQMLFLPVNIDEINRIELMNPSLKTYKNPEFIKKTFKLKYNSLLLSQFLKEINKSTQLRDKIINVPKKLYLSGNLNSDFEKEFFDTNLKNKNFFYKSHPSIGEDSDLINLNFLPWEIIQIQAEIKYLISYGSSTGLNLLNMNLNILTKYIFVFELFHDEKIVWFDYETEKEMFYLYKDYYPKNIFIPKSINELISLIEE